MNVTKFSPELLDTMEEQARQSVRKRQHLNIHKSFKDPCQRFFNAIGKDSYIRPHRHSLDPKTEDLFAIRGVLALVIFNEQGSLVDVTRFGTEKYGGAQGMAVGVELAPGAWHTVVALTDNAVILELKAGPFVATAAKEFASWAPEEGSAEASAYLHSLRYQISTWHIQQEEVNDVEAVSQVSKLSTCS